jgi:peptide/nickel transport system permease protein
MLSSGRTALAIAPHVATIPGLAIVLLAITFNLLGDGARDLLDPRMKQQP